MFPSTHWSVLLQPNEGLPQLNWDQFVRTYKAPVDNWFRGRGLQSADADDLTQRLLVRLHASIGNYQRGHGDFRPWLVSVMNNLLRDFYRERQRHPERGAGGGADAGVWEQLADPNSAEDLLSAVQTAGQRWMAAAMAAVEAKVQPHTWRAFVRHAIEGRPAPEVAAELGMTVTAVHTARYRTLNLIQAECTRLADEHSR